MRFLSVSKTGSGRKWTVCALLRMRLLLVQDSVSFGDGRTSSGKDTALCPKRRSIWRKQVRCYFKIWTINVWPKWSVSWDKRKARITKKNINTPGSVTKLWLKSPDTYLENSGTDIQNLWNKILTDQQSTFVNARTEKSGPENSGDRKTEKKLGSLYKAVNAPSSCAGRSESTPVQNKNLRAKWRLRFALELASYLVLCLLLVSNNTCPSIYTIIDIVNRLWLCISSCR